MNTTNTDSLINGNGEPPNYFSLCTSLGMLAFEGYNKANFAEGKSSGETAPLETQVQADFDELTDHWMGDKKHIVEAYHGGHISETDRDNLLGGLNLIYDAAADRLMAAKKSRR